MTRFTKRYIVLLILFSAMLPLSEFQIVEAKGTIYIRPDGSVEGTNKIQRDGQVYTLIGDIEGGIIVQKDNLSIEGRGYMLQGGGLGTGMDLSKRTNVIIQDINIRNFLYGIRLYSSFNNCLYDSRISNTIYAVRLQHSSNNTICETGVRGNFFGIWLSRSSDNFIIQNEIETNENDGIWLSSYSDNNRIFDNNITLNGYGIRIDDHSNNILKDNTLVDNEYHLGVFSSSLPEFTQCIDPSNLVDGKPVYYLINQHNLIVPKDGGWVALINCTNITAQDLDLTNNGQGLLMAYTTNSTITHNNLTGNIHGLYLSHSYNNTIKDNQITKNIADGIYLYYSSDNLLLNNFLNNSQKVYVVDKPTNGWHDARSISPYKPKNTLANYPSPPVAQYDSIGIKKYFDLILTDLAPEIGSCIFFLFVGLIVAFLILQK